MNAPSQQSIALQATDIQQTTFNCQHCFRPFAKKHALIAHLRKHTQNRRPDIETAPHPLIKNRQHDAQDHQINNPQQYVCRGCHKEYSYYRVYVSHLVKCKKYQNWKLEHERTELALATRRADQQSLLSADVADKPPIPFGTTTDQAAMVGQAKRPTVPPAVVQQPFSAHVPVPVPVPPSVPVPLSVHAPLNLSVHAAVPISIPNTRPVNGAALLSPQILAAAHTQQPARALAPAAHTTLKHSSGLAATQMPAFSGRSDVISQIKPQNTPINTAINTIIHNSNRPPTAESQRLISTSAGVSTAPTASRPISGPVTAPTTARVPPVTLPTNSNIGIATFNEPTTFGNPPLKSEVGAATLAATNRLVPAKVASPALATADNKSMEMFTKPISLFQTGPLTVPQSAAVTIIPEAPRSQPRVAKAESVKPPALAQPQQQKTAETDLTTRTTKPDLPILIEKDDPHLDDAVFENATVNKVANDQDKTTTITTAITKPPPLKLKGGRNRKAQVQALTQQQQPLLFDTLQQQQQGQLIIPRPMAARLDAQYVTAKERFLKLLQRVQQDEATEIAEESKATGPGSGQNETDPIKHKIIHYLQHHHLI